LRKEIFGERIDLSGRADLGQPLTWRHGPQELIEMAMHDLLIIHRLTRL